MVLVILRVVGRKGEGGARVYLPGVGKGDHVVDVHV